MTAPPLLGGFFDEQSMSEDFNQAAPEAADGALSETWDKAALSGATQSTEVPLPDGEAGVGDDDEGQEGQENAQENDAENRPRKKSRSERLRRQNERLQAELAVLKSGSAAAAVQDQAGFEAAVARKVGEPPREADYGGDWFAYERAMTAYEADRRQVSRQVLESVEQHHHAEQARISERLDDYVEQCEEVAKTIPDFKAVVTSPSFMTTDLVKRLILDAGEKAPLVAYNLAQNPKLCARINAMSPLAAAREIGRIEGRVLLPKNNATRAGPPLSAVRGSASPAARLGTSMSDYERWRNS